MVDTLIVHERKQSRLVNLKLGIGELNIAEANLAAKGAIREDEDTLLAKAIISAEQQVVYAQAVVDAINGRLQTLLSDTSNDVTYSATEKQIFSRAITNKEYI